MAGNKAKTLLMMCGSLGLGNSARLLGIAQALRHRYRMPRESLRILICAGGKSAAYWAANAASIQAEITILEDYRFSELPSQCSRVHWHGFVQLRNAAAYLSNSRRLGALLRHNPSDLALIDSDYHCLPLLLSGVSTMALGQARDVLRRHAAHPLDAIPQESMRIEQLDFIFQRLVSRLVFVPCFESGEWQGGKVRPVPLIVREEFTTTGRRAVPVSPLCVLTGGSGVGAARLFDYAKLHDLPIIGSLQEPSPVLAPEGAPLIDRASGVIIQGGLSSISECIARQKRMIICPIEGHGEQLANAFEVERRGLGIRISELSASPSLLLERLDRIIPAPAASAWPRVDGADIVAEALLEALGLESTV